MRSARSCLALHSHTQANVSMWGKGLNFISGFLREKHQNLLHFSHHNWLSASTKPPVGSLEYFSKPGTVSIRQQAKKPLPDRCVLKNELRAPRCFSVCLSRCKRLLLTVHGFCAFVFVQFVVFSLIKTFFFLLFQNTHTKCTYAHIW